MVVWEEKEEERRYWPFRRKDEGCGHVSVSHEGTHLLIYAEINNLYEAADELDAGASCESSVEGINDTTVSVESTHTLACREDCDIQGAVSGDGVQDLGR